MMSSWSRAGRCDGAKPLPVKLEVLNMAKECVLENVVNDWYSVTYKGETLGTVRVCWNGSQNAILKTSEQEPEISWCVGCNYNIEVPRHFNSIVYLLVKNGLLGDKNIYLNGVNLIGIITGVLTHFEQISYGQ
jgi:hypothetical protein